MLATLISLPNTLIAPPVSPACKPWANSDPLTVTEPVDPPSKTISPLTSFALVASTTPLTLITLCMTSVAVRAVIMTLPPCAVIRPEFSILAFPSVGNVATGVLIAKLSNLSPTKSSVMA